MKQAAAGSGMLNSGRPLKPGEVDRLGFRQIAEKLAAAIAAQSASDGLVLAIEGSWGSGKSSMVSLLAEALAKIPTDRPELVQFDPWLVGSRDALLTSLMFALASAVDLIEGVGRARKAKQLGNKIRTYGVRLGVLSAPLLKAAGLVVPGTSALADVVETLTKAAESAGSQTLEELKRELLEGLPNLKRRIVVIIDKPRAQSCWPSYA